MITDKSRIIFKDSTSGSNLKNEGTMKQLTRFLLSLIFLGLMWAPLQAGCSFSRPKPPILLPDSLISVLEKKIEEFSWIAIQARIDPQIIFHLNQVIKGQPCDINTPHGDNKMTALMAAVMVDCHEVIDFCLTWQTNIDQEDSSGLTALSYALLINPNPLIVQKLIENKANINHRTHDGSTPLVMGSRSVYVLKDPQRVKNLCESSALLLRWGADPHACTLNRDGTLDFAIAHYNHHLVKTIFENAGAQLLAIPKNKDRLALALEMKKKKHVATHSNLDFIDANLRNRSMAKIIQMLNGSVKNQGKPQLSQEEKEKCISAAMLKREQSKKRASTDAPVSATTAAAAQSTISEMALDAPQERKNKEAEENEKKLAEKAAKRAVHLERRRFKKHENSATATFDPKATIAPKHDEHDVIKSGKNHEGIAGPRAEQSGKPVAQQTANNGPAKATPKSGATVKRTKKTLDKTVVQLVMYNAALSKPTTAKKDLKTLLADPRNATLLKKSFKAWKTKLKEIQDKRQKDEAEKALEVETHKKAFEKEGFTDMSPIDTSGLLGRYYEAVEAAEILKADANRASSAHGVSMLAKRYDEIAHEFIEIHTHLRASGYTGSETRFALGKHKAHQAKGSQPAQHTHTTANL